MQNKSASRPDDHDRNESGNADGGLAQRLADEVEVLANDQNVLYVVRKAREKGAEQNLTVEQVAHNAAARVRKMYPVAYSNAGIVEAVRQVLAASG